MKFTSIIKLIVIFASVYFASSNEAESNLRVLEENQSAQNDLNKDVTPEADKRVLSEQQTEKKQEENQAILEVPKNEEGRFLFCKAKYLACSNNAECCSKICAGMCMP